MFGKHETDVLVVGAGPVGLMSALVLAERDVRTEIVDEEWRTGAHSYALALHPHSLALLDELGLAGEVLRAGRRIETVAFYDGSRRRSELHFARLPGEFPFLTVLRQDALEDLLEKRLAQRHIKVHWNHRMRALEPGPNGVTVSIDKLGKASCGYGYALTEWSIERTTATRAAFVVGADGRGSAVRSALEIPFDEFARPQCFAVFEFETDFDPGPEVRVVLDGRTTNVLWPLPDRHCRWSFELGDADVSDETRDKSRLAVALVGRDALPHVSEELLDEFLASRAPWFNGRIGPLRWAIEVRFEHRLADSFGRDRVWLAGDAAHVTGPVGVRSMNVGFSEAHDLGSRIARVLKAGDAPQLLAEYGARWREEWLRISAAEALTAAAADDSWVRDHAPRIAACIPAAGEDFDRLAAQVGLTTARAAMSAVNV
jgi:2-polyprenyl-6-methoxyphenol hydroxylase-like FAD-dependent oxidoreductase